MLLLGMETTKGQKASGGVAAAAITVQLLHLSLLMHDDKTSACGFETPARRITNIVIQKRRKRQHWLCFTPAIIGHSHDRASIPLSTVVIFFIRQKEVRNAI